MAKGVKTGGRKPGSLNKSTLAGVDFVTRVEKLLRKRDKTLSLEGVSVALLTCGNPIVIQKELQTLREYRYGKPKENQDDRNDPPVIIMPSWKDAKVQTPTE
jgi:hypothetical protein